MMAQADASPTRMPQTTTTPGELASSTEHVGAIEAERGSGSEGDAFCALVALHQVAMEQVESRVPSPVALDAGGKSPETCPNSDLMEYLYLHTRALAAGTIRHPATVSTDSLLKLVDELLSAIGCRVGLRRGLVRFLLTCGSPKSCEAIDVVAFELTCRGNDWDWIDHLREGDDVLCRQRARRLVDHRSSGTYLHHSPAFRGRTAAVRPAESGSDRPARRWATGDAREEVRDGQP